MDKLIEQALKKYKIVRYLDTFEEVMLTYKSLLEAEMEAKNISSNPVLADSSFCECSMEGSQHRKENAGKHCEMCGKIVAK